MGVAAQVDPERMRVEVGARAAQGHLDGSAVEVEVHHVAARRRDVDRGKRSCDVERDLRVVAHQRLRQHREPRWRRHPGHLRLRQAHLPRPAGGQRAVELAAIAREDVLVVLVGRQPGQVGGVAGQGHLAPVAARPDDAVVERRVARGRRDRRGEDRHALVCRRPHLGERDLRQGEDTAWPRRDRAQPDTRGIVPDERDGAARVGDFVFRTAQRSDGRIRLGGRAVIRVGVHADARKATDDAGQDDGAAVPATSRFAWLRGLVPVVQRRHRGPAHVGAAGLDRHRDARRTGSDRASAARYGGRQHGAARCIDDAVVERRGPGRRKDHRGDVPRARPSERERVEGRHRGRRCRRRRRRRRGVPDTGGRRPRHGAAARFAAHLRVAVAVRVDAAGRVGAAGGIADADRAVQVGQLFRVGCLRADLVLLVADIGLDRAHEIVARVVDAEGVLQRRIGGRGDDGDARQVDRGRGDLARRVAVQVVQVDLGDAVAGIAPLHLAHHVVLGVLLVDRRGAGGHRTHALVDDLSECVVLRELDLTGADIGLRDLAPHRVVGVGLGLVGVAAARIEHAQHGAARHAPECVVGIRRDIAVRVGLLREVAVGVVDRQRDAVIRLAGAIGAALDRAMHVAECVVLGVGDRRHAARRAAGIDDAGEARVALLDDAAEGVVDVGRRVAGTLLLAQDVAQAVVGRGRHAGGRARAGAEGAAAALGHSAVDDARDRLLGDAAGGVERVGRDAVRVARCRDDRVQRCTQCGRRAQVRIGHARVALPCVGRRGQCGAVLHLADRRVERVGHGAAADAVVVPRRREAAGVDAQRLAAGGVVVVVRAVAAAVDLLHHVAVGVVDGLAHRLRP